LAFLANMSEKQIYIT